MRLTPLIVTAAFLPSIAASQGRSYALESATGLRFNNVVAEPATLAGKKGLRVTISPEVMSKFATMTPEQRNQIEPIALIEGTDFSSGVIEAEIAGEPSADPIEGARGFVGIAFRVQPDLRTYDAFYIRPTNGRAEDQERRNHATQYISHPQWPWFRLRQETPSKYESYVDIQPGVWTKLRIEVRGDKARLFVNDNPQPVLIVNDVKSGGTARGGVALWIGPGTVAHFRNVVITADR